MILVFLKFLPVGQVPEKHRRNPKFFRKTFVHVFFSKALVSGALYFFTILQTYFLNSAEIRTLFAIFFYECYFFLEKTDNAF